MNDRDRRAGNEDWYDIDDPDPPHKCTTGSFWRDLLHNIFGGVPREDCIETKRVEAEIAERKAAQQKK